MNQNVDGNSTLGDVAYKVVFLYDGTVVGFVDGWGGFTPPRISPRKRVLCQCNSVSLVLDGWHHQQPQDNTTKPDTLAYRYTQQVSLAGQVLQRQYQ